MKLIKYSLKGTNSVGILEEQRIIPLNLNKYISSLQDIINSKIPVDTATSMRTNESINANSVDILAPIDHQEVWAAGVTYKRSQTARMKESISSASCYDLVYKADRPELFLKATPNRVSGPGQPVRIRIDSRWNVPEAELTCVINNRGKLVGYTIGNDMSSRYIEGENPLYLPQAKIYKQCASLGPCITLADALPPRDKIEITLKIEREGVLVFDGATKLAQLTRSFESILEYLIREHDFPNGVFLMTGTGIIPNNDFTLVTGDMVHISINGIGSLNNPVVQG